MLEAILHDKTTWMSSRRLRLWLRHPLPALLGASGAIAASAGLASCGGRAADGLGSDGSGAGASITEDDGDGSGGEPTFVGPQRETCEDNPLLAGCPYASSVGSAPAPDEPVEAPEEPPVDSPDQTPQYLAAAQNILSAYCAACHGPALTIAQASGGINYITDWDRLINEGLIQLCSPEGSRIVQLMRSGEMPPTSSGLPRVTDVDRQVVAGAIELDCYLRF